MNNDSELIERLFTIHPASWARVVALVRLKVFIYLAENHGKTFSLVYLENTLQATINTKYGKLTGALPYIFPSLEVLSEEGLVEKGFKEYNISPEGHEFYKENKKKLEKMLKEKRTKYTSHLIKS